MWIISTIQVHCSCNKIKYYDLQYGHLKCSGLMYLMSKVAEQLQMNCFISWVGQEYFSGKSVPSYLFNSLFHYLDEKFVCCCSVQLTVFFILWFFVFLLYWVFLVSSTVTYNFELYTYSWAVYTECHCWP